MADGHLTQPWLVRDPSTGHWRGVAGRYPAVIRLWDNAWAEFVPFLDYGACRRFAGSLKVASRLSPWIEGVAGVAGSRGGRAVDPQEVEGRGGKLEFAERGVQAAAGESVEDLLEVPDCWFNGGATPLVEGLALLGA